MKAPGNHEVPDVYTRRLHNSIQTALSHYELAETQNLYRDVMKFTREECKKLLRNVENQKIKGVVHGRIKQYKSLKNKLNVAQNKFDSVVYQHSWKLEKRELKKNSKKIANFGHWIASERKIFIHPEMGDLAGVRIGLYFPGDILKVTAAIEEHFKTICLFGTVTGGRDPITDRNSDPKKHLDGRWYSKDEAGTIEHWEHYGYKSWQVVVEFTKSQIESFAESFYNDSDKTPELLGDTLRNLGLKLPRVEIQVGTVATQAWAEVQHDVIYKNPDNIVVTPTIRRIIDAINGLAITTDIMLRELNESLVEAGEQQHFKDGTEFLSWFESTYLSKMEGKERQRWECDDALATKLVNALSFMISDNGKEEVSWSGGKLPSPCRMELKKIIEGKKLLELKELQETPKTDITEVLTRTMGLDLDDILAKQIEFERNKNESLGERAGIQRRNGPAFDKTDERPIKRRKQTQSPPRLPPDKLRGTTRKEKRGKRNI
ncbi:hypothetical protein F5B18DRAFT_408817 [Nemania serpens]|nr:hypothetical protein F5B18DRAFT_408817 [Nemania serpens]